MSFELTITKDYGKVLIAVLTFNLYCLFAGFVYGGGARKENFHFENVGSF